MIETVGEEKGKASERFPVSGGELGEESTQAPAKECRLGAKNIDVVRLKGGTEVE